MSYSEMIIKDTVRELKTAVEAEREDAKRILEKLDSLADQLKAIREILKKK